MPLYEPRGVFMQPYGPPAVGADAVRRTYVDDFGRFRLDVRFHIAEIVVMSPEGGFVRTSSAGTNTINATQAQSAEASQELFILRKGSDAAWRIARYSFSTTNPPDA